jgi:hypothetical protein
MTRAENAAPSGHRAEAESLQGGGMSPRPRGNGDGDGGKGRLLVALAALLPVLALYVLTGALSHGFDDEMYTIGWVTAAGTLSGLVTTIAQSDLHPPGSYLIVSLLHDLTGSFPAVRAIAGAVNAVMLLWLWRENAPRAPLAAFFAWLALCLSPTLLLWGATLRWYSWFVPLVAGLLILIRRNPAGPWRFWGGFAVAAVLLVHIGYFALVALPALLAAALRRRRDRLRREAWIIAATGGLALAAIAPQLLLALPGQLPGGALQHEQGLLFKAGGAALHTLSTHAAMPPSLPAATFVLGNLILLAGALRAGRAAFATSAAVVFLGGLALAFVAGLTGHFRSLVALSPAQGVWQGQLFAGLRAAVWRGTTLGLFLVGTGIGLVNVVTHSDTTKRGWNVPYGEILAAVSDFRDHCPAASAAAPVATHDPVLFYHLTHRQVPVLWADDRLPPSDEMAPMAPFDDVLATIREAPCVVTVETYRGSLSPELHRRYARAIAGHAGPREVRRLGPDRHADFKQLFDPAVPGHAAVVTYFPPPD